MVFLTMVKLCLFATSMDRDTKYNPKQAEYVIIFKSLSPSVEECNVSHKRGSKDFLVFVEGIFLSLQT